jgi:hypothetical protein
MDEFYKIEIIKFSEHDKVRKMLLKNLEHIKRLVKHPLLTKKIIRVLHSLENNKPKGKP